MKKIDVDLADHNSYSIYIAQESSKQIAEWLIDADYAKDVFIITNTKIASLYLDDFKQQFLDQQFKINEFIIEDSEESKRLDVAEQIYTALIETKCNRQTMIIAFGGGVVGDLAGFVAATYLRSVPFIQVPTTLLSQVDSSVGGKVAVNHSLGKNLIGAFYQPKAVFIDPKLLKTLDSREVICGMAECIKYGYIYDQVLLDFIKDNIDALLGLDLNAIELMIYSCVDIKRQIVEIDEKESGLRAILNFGHTFGHALEAATNYQGIKHGEAIISGMICALYASHRLHPENIDFETEKEFLEGLYKFENNLQLTAVQLIELMKHDKKVKDKQIIFILIKSIGKAITHALPEDKIESALDHIL